MAEIVLNVSASWDDDIMQEISAKLKAEINPAVAKANEAVGAEMRDALVAHLETDVYPESIYSPTEYQRRGWDGGLLGQAKNSAKIFSDSAHVTLDFSPSGAHTDERWHTVDADDLIGRIEKHNPEYTFKPKKKKIPDRPFWQNFVNEMVDSGGIEVAFQNAIMSALPDGWTFSMSGDGVVRDPQDGQYG